MHYSNNAHSCRADFFKPGGKWYDTISFSMQSHFNDVSINRAVQEALIQEIGTEAYKGMTVVVLHPSHKDEHPIMIHDWAFNIQL